MSLISLWLHYWDWYHWMVVGKVAGNARRIRKRCLHLHFLLLHIRPAPPIRRPAIAEYRLPFTSSFSDTAYLPFSAYPYFRSLSEPILLTNISISGSKIDMSVKNFALNFSLLCLALNVRFCLEKCCLCKYLHMVGMLRSLPVVMRTLCCNSCI